MPAIGAFRNLARETGQIATAANGFAKAKRPNFVQPLSLIEDPKRAPIRGAPSLHFDLFCFFFFFFVAMALFLRVTPREEQWLQRDECNMNRLWRIETDSGQATYSLALGMPAAKVQETRGQAAATVTLPT